MRNVENVFFIFTRSTETTELLFNGTLWYQLEGTTLQIKDLKMDYSFEKFKVRSQNAAFGAQVEGECKNQFAKHTKRTLRKTFFLNLM